jgi:hypothetical protein
MTPQRKSRIQHIKKIINTAPELEHAIFETKRTRPRDISIDKASGSVVVDPIKLKKYVDFLSTNPKFKINQISITHNHPQNGHPETINLGFRDVISFESIFNKLGITKFKIIDSRHGVIMGETILDFKNYKTKLTSSIYTKLEQLSKDKSLDYWYHYLKLRDVKLKFIPYKRAGYVFDSKNIKFIEK